MVLIGSTAIVAQSERLTAHPQDEPHQGGQVNPFGCLSHFSEARIQLFFEPQYLPGPGAVLVGMEVRPVSSGVVTYPSLALTVSPFALGMQASAVFASNLPHPTSVLQLSNHSIPWNSAAWERLQFSQPYVHDGVSVLVIDIQKVAVPCSSSGGSTAGYRPDLPTMLTAFGPAGSGMHQASVAMWAVPPIDVRLVWSNAPTLRLSSPVPAALHHGFAIGSTLDNVVAAAPGSLVGLIGDLQWSPPVTLPFASGRLWVQGVGLAVEVTNANGEAQRTFPIPALPAFIGQQLTYQALVLDPSSGQLLFTNAADCYVAP